MPNIIKLIKSIFEKDYIFNHYEQFVFNKLLNAANDDLKLIIKNQLQYIQFTTHSFDYHRKVRMGFTYFFFKKQLHGVLYFKDLKDIKTNNLLAKLNIIDKDSFKYEAYIYVNDDGLISDIKYFSSRITIKNKFLPQRPYYLDCIEVYS